METSTAVASTHPALKENPKCCYRFKLSVGSYCLCLFFTLPVRFDIHCVHWAPGISCIAPEPNINIAFYSEVLIPNCWVFIELQRCNRIYLYSFKIYFQDVFKNKLEYYMSLGSIRHFSTEFWFLLVDSIREDNFRVRGAHFYWDDFASRLFQEKMLEERNILKCWVQTDIFNSI